MQKNQIRSFKPSARFILFPAIKSMFKVVNRLNKFCGFVVDSGDQLYFLLLNTRTG
jgi:hypothetical protein